MIVADKIRKAAMAHFGDRSLLSWIKADNDLDEVIDAYVEDCRRICIDGGVDPNAEAEVFMKEAVHDLIREAWMRDSTGLYRFQVKSSLVWML